MIRRAWAMPNKNTFAIKPIAELLGRYAHGVVVDPFARDSTLATYTNDLDPNTLAESHLPAVEFLDGLLARHIVADTCLLDPPYSPRQITECYSSIGLKASQADTQNARLYGDCKDRMQLLTKAGGIVICFGWNSSGMGKCRGFELVEILLVAHGAAHNDTIVTVERKR